MRRLLGLVLLLFANGLTIAAFAQSESATISGRVSDPQGQAVAGAEIQVVNTDTNASANTKTNADGLYVIASLHPGPYRILVLKDGFKEVVKTGLVLHVQDIAAENFSLQVGSVSESVTVTADQLNINTTDGTVSTVVDRQFVENLPLNGRSFHALLELTPGVVLTPTQDQGEQGQFSINGNRADANYFSIDGASANFGVNPTPIWGQNAAGALPALSAAGGTNNLVSVDALQEFRVETSSFAPEFGRGGAQVALVTRSGNNTLHGTIFDYLRNDAFDANDWFGNSRGLTKPAERQNDFGGVLGGPILKDKTFFFVSYEGLRLRQPKTAITDVPSLEARQNAVPAAQPFLNAFPLPNGPATITDPDTGAVLANEYDASYSDPATLNATSVRIDQILNSKVTLFGRYNYAPSNADLRAGGGGESIATHILTNIGTQTATVGLTATLSPRLISDFRFNYSKATGSLTFKDDTFGGGVPAPSSVIFPAGFGSSANSDGGMFISGLRGGQVEYGVSAKNNQETQFNVIETLSYTHGAHQWKYGFDFRRLDAIPGFRKFDVLGVEFSIQHLIDGSVDVWILENNAVQPHLRFYNYSAFAQDTWKVSPRLNLTYGIRWEHNPPPSETTGNPPFAVTQVTDLSAMQLAPRGTPLWKTSWANFAPRFGIAYSLNRNASRPLVIRGGVGVFYSLGTETAGGVAAARRWPYSASSEPSNVPLPLTLPPPDFNAIFTPPFGLTSLFDPNLKVPYSGQWSISVERGISTSQKFSVSYIGSVGRRLLRQEGLNSALLPVNPIFSEFYLTKNESYSNYNALQLQYQRHLSHGLQALISYTWSHSLDNASSDQPYGVGSDNGGLLPSGFYDVHNDYGASNFDIRHSFNGTLTYDLPGRGLKTAVLRHMVGGWSIDGIVRARSAPPFTVVYGPNSVTSTSRFIDPGQGVPMNFRPDLVPGQPIFLSDPTAPGGKKLNINAFSITPNQDRQGNLGRNTFRAFGAVQSDLSLRRQFNLGEKVKMMFRTDAFNIFNHPNFGYPSSFLGVPGFFVQPGFGEAQATLANTLGQGGAFGGGFNPLYAIGGPRSLQLSLKLQF